MGDRICVRLIGKNGAAPMFYGHWCGLRALKVMNEAIREESNGIENTMCNFIVKIMEGKTNPYSYYLYNDPGEPSDIADWDNYCWTYDATKGTWTTTVPSLVDRELTLEQVDEYVKEHRPCLFRECPCEIYHRDKEMGVERTHCEMLFYERLNKEKTKRDKSSK